MNSEIFNTKLLLLARGYRRRSQAEVANRAGLTQGHYSRIENGLLSDGPSREHVEKIAYALEFPPDFFYQEDGLEGLPLSVHPMNRKKASVGERDLRQIHSELNIRLIHLRRYLRAVDIDPELPRPFIDVDEGGGPQVIAQKLRAAWSVSDGPIGNLIDLCERAGILVVLCEFDGQVDGVTLNVRDLPPCIFLNSQVPADRLRSSLAHELGHVVMHRIPTDTIEEEANAFAGELLLPEKGLKRAVIGHRVTTDWLARQKAYWRVSMGFILYRLGFLGLIKQHQSQYLWKKMSAMGWRTREPQSTDFPAEKPTLFPEIVRVHAEDLGYGLDDLHRLLNHDVADIRRLYGDYLGRQRLYAISGGDKV